MVSLQQTSCHKTPPGLSLKHSTTNFFSGAHGGWWGIALSVTAAPTTNSVSAWDDLISASSITFSLDAARNRVLICQLMHLPFFFIYHFVILNQINLSASNDDSITFQGHNEKRSSNFHHVNFWCHCLVHTVVSWGSYLSWPNFIRCTLHYWHCKRIPAWNKLHGKLSTVTLSHCKVLLMNSEALICLQNARNMSRFSAIDCFATPVIVIFMWNTS